MVNYIYAKTTGKGKQSFYLLSNGWEYYLFTQKFFKSVRDFFLNKVLLDVALDKTKSNRNVALLKTMERLFLMIKYVEKEFDLIILEQTAKKNKKHIKQSIRKNNFINEI